MRSSQVYQTTSRPGYVNRACIQASGGRRARARMAIGRRQQLPLLTFAQRASCTIDGRWWWWRVRGTAVNNAAALHASYY